MNSALVIIALTAILALALGLAARRGVRMTLEQWTVGGRGFGAPLVFLLTAGEIYTTFTFLGGSGYAYGKGAPAYYILAYGTLAYILSYWLLPPIWRYARQERLVSQSHFFTRKYDSPWLGILVAVIGVVALVPYLVLQFKGLGIIVTVASYGSVSSTAAIWIGAATVTIYVMVSGMHGAAWNAVVKDALILAVVVFLGIYLPFHYYGGYSEMFRAIDAAQPGMLAFKPTGQSVLWFQSTVALTALGFYMWPHAFAAVFTAKHERTFRRNAMALPLYQLILLFVFFSGFAAILKVPGLTGADIDLSLFKLSIQTFDPWFVGVIGAAGVLTASGSGLDDHPLGRNLDRQRSGASAGPRYLGGRGDAHRARRRSRAGAGGGVLHLARGPDDRRAAADGLLFRHPIVPGAHLQPDGAQPDDQTGRGGRHHRGRGRRRLCHVERP